MKKKIIFVTILSFIVIIILLFVNVLFLPSKISDQPIVVYIEKGSTKWQVANLLKEKGLIKSKISFYILSVKKSFIAGEYEFNKTMNLLQILNKLEKGDIILHRITIPEGWTSFQIADILEKELGIPSDEFLRCVNENCVSSDEYLFVPESGSLEGFLFPDTYFLTKCKSVEDIIRRMLNRFEEVVPENIKERANKLGLTVEEAINLASLVEKEAKYEDERPLIASVLLNRYRKGMKLQCDATVQYALGHKKYRRLYYKDLKVDSPYNTYLHPNFPPTPIANPGLSSIKAALSPAQTDYLFYVARNDGTHIFSKDYKSHLRAIRKIRGS